MIAVAPTMTGEFTVANIDGNAVTKVGKGAFSHNRAITSIVLDKVTVVDDYASALAQFGRRELYMLINNDEYLGILNEACEFIRKAQYNAVVGANYALIKRNYRLGKLLISKSEWGNKFIDNLAQDIKTEFPETTGFSVRNLKYMKKFAKLFVEDEIDENNFAAITWYHHIALMDKTLNKEQYIWYLGKTIRNNFH